MDARHRMDEPKEEWMQKPKEPMVAAVFARKSTSQIGDAEAKSVHLQIANAKAFVERQGGTVLLDHVYADDGVSGADVARLVQRNRLLSVIHAGRPPFNTLVMRD